jgi:hypothetical protein
LVEGDLADMCAEKFLLVTMWGTCQACVDGERANIFYFDQIQSLVLWDTQGNMILSLSNILIFMNISFPIIYPIVVYINTVLS